jgi:zinc protease
MSRLWIALTLLVAALPLALSPQGAGAQAATWKQVPVPALHKFQPQEPRRIQFANGLVVFLQEDHELPLIDGFARIRGGSRDEAAEKTGLVDIFGDVWRTGGTSSKTGDQLDDFLEARAAKVETGGSIDSTSISFSCLKNDFDDVFAVFLDLLRHPEFREEKIGLAKDQSKAGISRRNDDPGGIAVREAAKLGYGARNPYARQEEYATIAAVTRTDLLNWRQAHVAPNNTVLGIVGDFDAATMETRLRQALGDWARGPARTTVAATFQPASPGYYLVEKTDVNQSNIRMVELGTTRNNPDYFAIEVFNEAFAGGFSARLFSNIRTRKGLAYAVGGGIGAAFDHRGLVRLGMSTKSESTVEAIQALYEEVDGLAKNPLTAEEIQHAKDNILNSFIFNFDSPDKVLRERMAYEFYGYPADFLQRFRDGIEKITPVDVARIPAKYLHRDKLAVLVVGNPAGFDKPLANLGPVTKLDVTIPPDPERGQ